MNAYITAIAPRLIASVIAVGVTLGLFSAVVAPAMQPQVDGSVRLAHAALSAPPEATTVLLAQAATSSAR